MVMDREAWHAAVSGTVNSDMIERLRDFNNIEALAILLQNPTEHQVASLHGK